MVRIELLGHVRAHVGGDPVGLRGASGRTVLAALALRAGSVVSTDQLAEALWGEDPPSGAVANIQSVVSRLRRGLGEATIETVPPGYRLVADRVEVDLADLEDLLAGSGPDTLERLGTLLASWEGDPLAGVSESDWFLPDRSRLTELRLVARDRHNAGLLESGAADAALVDLRRVAAEEPLRESTQLLLAESLHRLGRTAEALRAIDAYRRHLVAETGLDPSTALVALEARLLDGSEEPDPAGVVGSAPRSAGGRPSRRWLPPETPFVGRSEELARLRELLSANRLVTVIGTGGVGKSRLVMEYLASGADHTPAVVLLASIGPTDSVAAALAAELGVEAAPEALLDAIAARLDLEDTLVVLDNCEHVRDPAGQLVAALGSRVENLRVLATSRRRLDLAEEQLLMLEPLSLPAEPDPSAAAVQLFCDRVARAAPHMEQPTEDLALATDICRLLGGLPLAMELAAARAHMLGLAELRAQLVRGRLPTSTGSATMQEAVSWSLDLLGEDARRLFAEACVFRSTFDLESLGAVSGLDDPIDALAELVDASMLSVVGGRSGNRYRVLEPIRQALPGGVPDATVAAYADWVVAMGERIRAAYLGCDTGTDVAVLLENRKLAIDLLLERSDDFQNGLALLHGSGDLDRFAELALALSYPLSRRPLPGLVSMILERCPDTAAGLAARADLEWCVGRPQDCVSHVDQLLGEIDPEHPWVVKALGASCPAYSYIGDVEQMSAAAQRMAAHPAAAELERMEAVGLWALGELYAGDALRAASVLEEHSELLPTAGLALLSFVRAEIASEEQPEEALRWLERGATEARQTGDYLMARLIEVALLAMLVRAGRHSDAATLAQSLVPELLRAGLIPQAWMSLRHVASLLAEVGEPRTALLVLNSAADSEDAPELVGEAVESEAALRRRINGDLEAADGSGNGADFVIPGPLAPRRLWAEVDAALGFHDPLGAST